MALQAHQARNHGVAWGGTCHPWVTGCRFFATAWKFFAFVYCWCIYVAAKERPPEILLEINKSLFNILESATFPSHK